VPPSESPVEPPEVEPPEVEPPEVEPVEVEPVEVEPVEVDPVEVEPVDELKESLEEDGLDPAFCPEVDRATDVFSERRRSARRREAAARARSLAENVVASISARPRSRSAPLTSSRR